MAGLFQYGSSSVDWCEKNYAIYPSIAEYANTISNVVFLVIPPILVQLFHQYGKFVSKGIYLVWSLFLFVGLSSAYFHATLSLLGQFLDELSILWLIATGFALWFPRRLLPAYFHGNRKSFQKLVILIASLATALSCLEPTINAFALMLLGVPSTAMLVYQVKRCPLSHVVRLGRRCIAILLLALICWLTDRFACNWSWRWGIPSLHALWHILICLGSYSSCVLLAYFDAINEVPEQSPVLKFWPYNSFEFGIPYVFLKTGHRSDRSPSLHGWC